MIDFEAYLKRPKQKPVKKVVKKLQLYEVQKDGSHKLYDERKPKRKGFLYIKKEAL